MGRKLGALPTFDEGELHGSPSNTISLGSRPTFLPSDSLIHRAIWSQQIWAENWGLYPFGGGLAGSPSNTMWPGPRPTCMPSFILIRPTVWPQYTNVTDRQTGQWSDSIGRTVLQTVAQKSLKMLGVLDKTTTRTVLRPFVRDYPGEPVPEEHSPTDHPDHPIFISFFHLPRPIASSLIKLRAWQSFCTTSLHVLFGLPLGLEPSTSYSIHFFTQSVSSFRNTCPYHHNLFCCSISIISSIPSLSVNSLLGTLSFTLTVHIHLTILIPAC